MKAINKNDMDSVKINLTIKSQNLDDMIALNQLVREGWNIQVIGRERTDGSIEYINVVLYRFFNIGATDCNKIIKK